MYFSVFPNKDTTITNVDIDSSPKTGSNSGKSEIAELFVLTSSAGYRGISRVLMQFDLTGLSQSISDNLIPSSGVQYKLVLKDAPHVETVPYDFDIELFMLTKSWTEGRGLANYDENLVDGGNANWKNASSLELWGSVGGDFTGSLSATAHFTEGTEDLNIDISHFVYAWLTGGVSNNGLIIKYTDFYETGSSDLFNKKFFTRHVHKPERTPRLDCLWTDFLQDDRSNMHYNVSGVLYYYNIVNGQYKNVSEPLYVDILNSSSTVIQTLTASKHSTGKYSVSGVLVSPTSSTQIFRDVWFNTSQLFTGNFTLTYSTGSSIGYSNELAVRLASFSPTYSKEQKATITVLTTEKDYKPAVRKSGSTTVDVINVQEMYYSIENADSEEVIIGFSTGSNKYSKLSYDSRGNYFVLDMNSLLPGSRYKIKFLADYGGYKKIYDGDWTFRVDE